MTKEYYLEIMKPGSPFKLSHIESPENEIV
jgi:hypothetical protein